jgi:Putative peptidoglycan binding domain/N-acetylmuramoyl-L-alanine amidase
VSFQVAGMRKVAAILKARGIKVTEVSGWTTRGRSTFEPRAVVCHWTVATRSITPTLVHGRGGSKPVPGPLCNFEVLPGGDGVKLIAAGKANHAGSARNGFTNSVSFGIEAAGPPIGRDEMRVYHALVAAICKVYGFPVGQRVRDHHEVALPVGRKVDISRDHDMGAFRRRVAALTTNPASMVVRRGKRKDGKPWYPGLRKIGMHGKASGPGAFVAMIQKRLNEWTVAKPPLKVDGDFGTKTRDAVAAFQRKRGIAPVTGAVGPRTWYALFDKPR